MLRENVEDLLAFMAVARDRSFTKAAAKLGISQSSLSQIVRGLEERLGLRLLTRTTRSVAPTDAGQQLLDTLGPHFEGIEEKLVSLTALRDKPAGTLRITSIEHALDTVLWPAFRKMLVEYPDIAIETVVDYGLSDIVAERYDAGVRIGEQVAKGMIAVRIGPELRMAVVGTPEYFETHGKPVVPQDLTEHKCINLRLPTHGGLYAWEFEKHEREVVVRVEGQLVFNIPDQMLKACLEGFGLAFVLNDTVQRDVEGGRLIRVLEDWCPPFPGYHLYYPSRRQHSPAFAVLLDALRYRG